MCTYVLQFIACPINFFVGLFDVKTSYGRRQGGSRKLMALKHGTLASNKRPHTIYYLTYATYQTTMKKSFTSTWTYLSSNTEIEICFKRSGEICWKILQKGQSMVFNLDKIHKGYDFIHNFFPYFRAYMCTDF